MSSQIRENLQKFFVLGVSYRKTALDVRGRFSLTQPDQEALLRDAKEAGVEGLIVLSTCNRTEIYAHTSDMDLVKKLFLSYCKGNEKDFRYNGYTIQGSDCIKHLYKVCSGIDSQIVGDFQIVGQVKNAYQLSDEYQMINSFLNRLFSFVFKASKKIKNETDLSRGAASVSHAAVQYIKDKVSDLESANYLLFGTGEIGKDTCSNLLKHMGNRSLTLVNRNVAKAEALANKYDISYRAMSDLAEEVAKSEVIIVATGAPHPTLKLEHFEGVTDCKLILDLSVPRNVDSAIDNLENTLVITVDELSEHISEAIQQRLECIPKAEDIIDDSIREFYGWLEITFLSPVIVALKENLNKIREKELEYHRPKMNEAELKRVEKITSNLMNKIARACISHLKDHHKTQSSPMETLNMLFQEPETK